MASPVTVVQHRLSPWVCKAIVIGFCGVIAIAALLGAISNVARSANPHMVMRLVPFDALAPAVMADRLTVESAGLVPSPRAAALALRSLKAQAINPRALRVLGFLADANNDRSRARTLIGLSAATTRRDLATQLWLIEDSVQRNDVQGALSHYDIALRASPQSREVLLPILTNALMDGELRRAVAPYIRANVPWLYSFVAYAVPNSKQPSAIAATLALGGGMPTDAIYRDLEARLIAQLVEQGDYAAARRYYTTLKGSNGAIFTEAGFSPSSTDQHFAPITWQLTGSSAIGAAFEGLGDQIDQVRVFANSGERSVVLRRLLFLPPGRYIFREVRKPLHMGADAEASWELKCVSGQKLDTLWRSDTSGSLSDRGVVKGLTIPQSCSQQYLELTAAGGSDQEGMELLITSFSVSPANSAVGRG